MGSPVRTANSARLIEFPRTRVRDSAISSLAVIRLPYEQ